MNVYYIAHIQKNISHSRSVLTSSHDENQRNISKITEAKPASNIFTYVHPPKAGNGSYVHELQRFRMFMSSQGVICQNIRHFGGKYFMKRKPPDDDPDGTWYLCLDPEISLDPKSCIVYSIG